MCSCDFGDGPSAFRSETRKARKVHRCCECRRTIEPGHRYEYASGVWDGRGDDFKTCERCVRLRAAHVEAGDDCLPVFGELISQIGECAREEPEYVEAFRFAYRVGPLLVGWLKEWGRIGVAVAGRAAVVERSLHWGFAP